MSRNHRPLLPSHSRNQEINQSSRRTGEIPPKRVYRGVGSCDRCRLKKLKCDRGRPSCNLCMGLSVLCEYQNAASVNQHKESANILRQLISGPEDEAIEKLSRLRAGTLRASDLTLDEPSSSSLDRAVSPSGFSTFEVELTARHQSAYPRIPPVDVSNIVLEPFSIANEGVTGMTADTTNEPSIWDRETFPLRLDHFRSLDMSYWTTIPIRNELAITIITTYLSENHHMFGFFDAEPFLNDLLERKLDFCSAFLVHSVFSCACLWYCFIDPSSSNLSKAFLEAAETLWLAERQSDSLLSVAALMVTGVACEIQSSNIRVVELFQDAQDMAERLGLFGGKNCGRNAANWQGLSTQVKRQTTQVAWGAYNWLSRNTYYLPVKPIPCPPTVPIPGEGTHKVTERQLIGKGFGALSRLWIIVQEVAAVYSLYRPASDGTLPLSFVESGYQKLLHWADTLDDDLLRGEHDSNQVLFLHITFHCTVINIFRPFYLRTPAQTLRSFSSPDSTATSVIRASANQLKQILVKCHVERHSILRTMITGTALLHIFNQVLEEFTSDSNWDIQPTSGIVSTNEMEGANELDLQFYLVLCITRCQELAICCPVFVSVGRGLLGMALQVGALSVDEALVLANPLQAHSSHHDAAALRGDFGDFVIDFNLAAKVPEAAQAKVVASRLEEMIFLNNASQNGESFSL